MRKNSIGQQQKKSDIEDPLEMPVGKMVETLKPLFFKYGVTQQHLAAARRNDEIAERINRWVADLYIEHGLHPYPSDKKLLSLIKRSEYAGLRDWHNYMGLKAGEVDVALPKNIKSALFSPCPFVANKMRIDTHFLCCFPHTFNGNEVSVDGAIAWQKAAKKGGPAPLIIRPEITTMKAHCSSRPEGSRWFLIFRGLIPGSHNLARQEQTNLMPKGYRFAKLLEVAYGLGLCWIKNLDLGVDKIFLGTISGTATGRIYEVSYSAELKSFGAEYAFCRNMGGSSLVGAFATMEL